MHLGQDHLNKTHGHTPLEATGRNDSFEFRYSTHTSALFRSSHMAAMTEAGAGDGEPVPVPVPVPVPEKVVEAKEEDEVKEGEWEQGKDEKKKARKARTKKPRSEGPHHPPYFEMIKEAIMALDGNGKAGSSPYAIAKHMEEKHAAVLPANYRKVLAVQLRNFAAKGRLVKVKASFKLAPSEEKKAVAAASRKRRAAQPSSAKKKAPARPSARAKRAKKALPAKPKQPKSIRTGAAKKANKASA